jgi:hypothetical protein
MPSFVHKGSILFGLLLLGCANPTDGETVETITITPQVWAGYETYTQRRKPGAFAVSSDGLSYGTSYCSEIRCKFGSYSLAALETCREGAGMECRLFALGTEIKVPYRIKTFNAALPASSAE